jgi:GT2 family glycosyltransferase
MSKPYFSVVVVNYNGKAFIAECIESVLKSTFNSFEVVLVDNASTDGGIALIEQRFGGDERLRIVKNPRNLHFVKGNNIVMLHARE